MFTILLHQVSGMSFIECRVIGLFDVLNTKNPQKAIKSIPTFKSLLLLFEVLQALLPVVQILVFGRQHPKNMPMKAGVNTTVTERSFLVR